MFEIMDGFSDWVQDTKFGKWMQKRGEKNIEMIMGAKDDPTTTGEALRSGTAISDSHDEALKLLMPGGFEDLTDKDYKDYVTAMEASNEVAELTDLKRWSDSYDKHRKNENWAMATMLATKEAGAKGFYQVTLQSLSQLQSAEAMTAGGVVGAGGAVAGSFTGPGALATGVAGWWTGANVMSESLASFNQLLQELSLIHISEPTRPY